MSIQYKKYKIDGKWYDCAVSLVEGDMLYVNDPSVGERYFLVLGKDLIYCPHGIHNWEFPGPHYLLKNMSDNEDTTGWVPIVKMGNVSYMKV